MYAMFLNTRFPVGSRGLGGLKFSGGGGENKDSWNVCTAFF